MSPAAIEAVKSAMHRAGFRACRPGKAWLVVVAVAAAGVIAALTWYGRSPGPDELWRQAQEAIQARQWERAEAELAKLGRARPATPEDWMLRAQLAMARGQVDAALADLARIPDAHVLALQARLRAGQLELRRNRIRAAEEALRAALALDPGLVQARRELIYIYGMQKRRAALDEQFRALAKLTPLTFDNVLHWSMMSNESWEPDLVTAELGRFVEADPTDRWSRLAWAGSLRRIGHLDEAWRALEVLPATDPEARALRAQLALERGDAKVAEALLSEGPTGHADLARLRGRLALSRRDGTAAVRHFTEADAARPGSRDVTLGLGQAWTLLGDEAKAGTYLAAVQDYEVMSSLLRQAQSPSEHREAELLRKLGEACATIGRQDEARAWLALALARDPLDSEAQRALFRLRAGSDGVGAQATSGATGVKSP